MLRRRHSSLVLSVLTTSAGVLWLSASGLTCASGNQGPGGSSTASSGTHATSSTASGSTGGAGGQTTASSSTSGTGGGTGGAGASAASSSSSGTSSSSSASSSAASSSSGAVVATKMVYAAESSEMVGYSYDFGTMMAGFATPWTSFSNDALGLAFTGNGAAVLVANVQAMTDAGTVSALRYVSWTGSWVPGFGLPFSDVQFGQTISILGGPSVAGSSIRAHMAYQGTDMSFYYGEYFSGNWIPAQEAITANNIHSSGPVPPAITTLNDTPIIAFVGNDGNIYDQTRNNGTWQGANGHGVIGTAAPITPSIVALTQNAELCIVYVNTSQHGLMYTIRTAGTWSTPAAITNNFSNDQLALAPLAAGGAVLTYKGTDGHLYTTLLSASSPFTWSAPAKGVMGADPVLVSPPAVATGATGAQAELLYLDMNVFTLNTARMNNGAWGPPVNEGSASYRLAIATGN